MRAGRRILGEMDNAHSGFLVHLSVLERLGGAHGLVIDREREEVRVGRRLVLRGDRFATGARHDLGAVLNLELERVRADRDR